MPKINPVEKKGGMRKVVKKQPKKNQVDMFKERKNIFFSKKICQYRFLFYCDFSVEDVAFLLLFSAWIKTNEKYFDSVNTCPFYGFIVDNEKKKKRAETFLSKFLTFMEYDDDHELYKAYISAQKRLYLETDDISFDLKAGNLFVIYMKTPHFVNNLKKESYDWLKSVASIVCLKDNYSDICDFLNRDSRPIVCIKSNAIITFEENKHVFDEIYNVHVDDMSFLLKDAIISYGKKTSLKISERLSELEEFKDCDFSDIEDLRKCAEKVIGHEKDINELSVLLENNLNILPTASPLIFISMIIGQSHGPFKHSRVLADNGTLRPISTGSLWKLEAPDDKSKIYVCKYILKMIKFI